MTIPHTLNELINSREFQNFQADKLGNDLLINDPDRAKRCFAAAAEGCDGSYTFEIIEDWREFLKIHFDELQNEVDPDLSIEEYDNQVDALEDIREFIESEIDSCEDWHDKNGTLNQAGG